jgi:tryptophan synthase beta chain
MKDEKGFEKILLTEDEVPLDYYNILPDLPKPLEPPLNPATKEPVSPKDLEAIFCKESVRQEVSRDRFVRVPEEVRNTLLSLGRPTAVFRARRLEKVLKTPAKIFFKHEGSNVSGSHKINTAVAQAYYASREGVEELVTETGAGQWGTALSCATSLFGLKARVFMVKTSFEQKPYRKVLMQTLGGKVISSPSKETDYGRQVLKENPAHPGSLGVAISEAIETVVSTGGRAKYSLGSVLNHVLLHQTIIGEEARLQFEKEGIVPDCFIGCVGGGSNFAGFAYPFLRDKLARKGNYKEAEFLAIEPTAAPSITKGKFAYDHGDSAGMTPLVKMFTLGKDFVPSPIHAGGLRYHGMAPSLSLLAKEGFVKARAYEQKEVFEAGVLFARTEGILPAPESSHAIKAAIDVALECKRKNDARTIAFNLSGQGLLDLNGYESFLEGKIK